MMDLYPQFLDPNHMSDFYPYWLELSGSISGQVNIICLCNLTIYGRSVSIDSGAPRFIKKIRGHVSSSVDIGQSETKIK